MDPDQMVKLVQERGWVPLAALVIYLVVRLLKSDTKIPITIRPRLRGLLAIGLGAVSAVLERLTQHVSWKDALVGGATSFALSMVFHETVVGAARAGKEFVLPASLQKLDKKPSPCAPVTKESAPPPVPSPAAPPGDGDA